MKPGSTLERAAEWAGWPLSPTQITLLRRYGDWLISEGRSAGGIGPHEADRVEERHLADSLLFARAWPPPSPPSRVVDLGSGVGLPGVPLAILWPGTETVLVERSQRRADLLNRLRRILELPNVSVVVGEAATVRLSADFVVGRAVAEPAVFKGWAERIVLPGGRIAVGGSAARPAPAGSETIIEVPPEILDRPGWIRMITPS